MLAVLSPRIEGNRPGQLAAGAATMTRGAATRNLPRSLPDGFADDVGPRPGAPATRAGAEGGHTAVAVLVAGVADLARTSQAAQLTNYRVRQGRQCGDAYVAIDNT